MAGSDVVGEQVIRLRKRAGLTREQLAVRCTELGWPALTFGAISSIETGRRDKDTGRRRRHITVEERDVLAAALGVPPALLEAPLGSTEPVEALPGRLDDAWTVYRWQVGEFPTEMLGKQRDPAVNYFRSDQAAKVIGTYRRHHNALYGFLVHRTQNPSETGKHLALLAAARIEMSRDGWWLPPLPDDVRDGLREPLLAWGYREDNPGELVEIAPPGFVSGDFGEVSTQ